VSDFEITPPELFELDPSSGDVFHEYFNHFRKLNDVYYDQIKIADQKAAYIFTFVLAFLVSSSEVRKVFALENYASLDLITTLFSSALALACTISIVCALLVVAPRRVAISTSLFWGTWPRHRPLLESAALRGDMQYLLKEYLNNADVLSLISRRKYMFVGMAFRSLIATVICYVLLLTFG